RRLAIEQTGPQAAVVTIDGTYDLAPVGGGGLSVQRRYAFSAGSPTAIVRQSVNWEGDRCGAGNLACGGSPNALKVQQVRDGLRLGLAFPLAATVIAEFQAPSLQGNINAGESASIRQRLRSGRTAPLSF